MHFSSVKKKQGKKGYHHNTFIMTCFYAFAEARLGRTILFQHEYTVDACLDGMEEGELDVFSKNRFFCYFWEQFMLLPLQWVRLCAILQRQGIASSILWSIWSRFGLADPPELGDNEYMWEDLESIQSFLTLRLDFFEKYQVGKSNSLDWIERELERRRAWFTGLRRVWLLAAVRNE
jgi:hypothetical protein